MEIKLNVTKISSYIADGKVYETVTLRTDTPFVAELVLADVEVKEGSVSHRIGDEVTVVLK